MYLAVDEKLLLYLSSDEFTKVFLVVFCCILFGLIIGLFVWFFKKEIKKAPERQRQKETAFANKMARLRARAGECADKEHLTLEDEASMTTVQKNAWLKIGVEKAFYKTSWANIDLFGSEKLSTKVKALAAFFVWLTAFLAVIGLVAYIYDATADSVEKSGNDVLKAVFIFVTILPIFFIIRFPRMRVYFDEWKYNRKNKLR